MERGFVKLWRKSMASAVITDPELWKLWCLCLMEANHKDGFVSIHGIAEPVKIKAGSFMTGRFELHKAYYPKKKKNNKSPVTIWRKLQTLENMENLIIRSHAKYSIISICNWAEYQQNDQPVINRRSTGDQPTITNKNDKNVKKKEIKKEKHLEYVELTEKEETKIRKRFGDKGFTLLIEYLNNYLGANTNRLKKYTSHYHVIIGWVQKEVFKERPMEVKDRSQKITEGCKAKCGKTGGVILSSGYHPECEPESFNQEVEGGK